MNQSVGDGGTMNNQIFMFLSATAIEPAGSACSSISTVEVVYRRAPSNNSPPCDSRWPATNNCVERYSTDEKYQRRELASFHFIWGTTDVIVLTWVSMGQTRKIMRAGRKVSHNSFSLGYQRSHNGKPSQIKRQRTDHPFCKLLRLIFD